MTTTNTANTNAANTANTNAANRAAADVTAGLSAVRLNAKISALSDTRKTSNQAITAERLEWLETFQTAAMAAVELTKVFRLMTFPSGTSADVVKRCRQNTARSYAKVWPEAFPGQELKNSRYTFSTATAVEKEETNTIEQALDLLCGYLPPGEAASLRHRITEAVSAETAYAERESARLAREARKVKALEALAICQRAQSQGLIDALTGEQIKRVRASLH